jgi:hypothetical protein
MQKVLVEVVNKFQDRKLAADDYIIDGAQVLSVFGEADTTRVRYNGNLELLGHEHNSQSLIHTTQAAGIDLADINGAGHEQLLEHDTVLAHFTGGDANAVRLESLPDGLVAHDIVWRSWLFDEPGLEFAELLHVVDRLGDGPHLVGVDHEDVTLVEAEDLSCNSQASLVLLDVSANLDLEVSVSLGKCVSQQLLHLLLSISQPSCTCRVSRDSSVLKSLFNALGLAGLLLAQHLNGFLWGDGIGDVAEINASDVFLWRHVGDDAPDRLVECLCPQIPDCVNNGAKRKMDDALFGANPPQLAVVDKITPCLSPVGYE